MPEHVFREWVPLQWLKRSESLTRMAEHISSRWVPPTLCEQFRTTDKNDWTHLQVVSPTAVIEQIKITDNAWTCIKAVSFSLVFEQIWTTDKNGWTCIQGVSSTLVFKHIRVTDKNGWTHIQRVSPPLVFEHIKTANKNGNTYPASESLFSVWSDQHHWQEWLNTYTECESVSKCLSRSKPLTRMAEHISRLWVPLLCLSKSELISMAKHTSRL